MTIWCLAVEEVGRHEELQGDLRGDGELRDLGGGVGVPGRAGFWKLAFGPVL